ncbi:MAG: DUF4384 domain-containing protein [Opitutales bacterium]|nr:DUF4384 domain-containing protein [Opitutales bacterium]
MADSRTTEVASTPLRAIIERLQHPVLLFSLGIALVIVSGFQLFGEQANLGVGALLLVFAAGLGVFALMETRRPTGTDPGKRLSALGPGVSGPLHVRLWLDAEAAGAAAGSRSIRIEAAPEAQAKTNLLRIGSLVRFNVSVSHNCHLTLVNIGTDGNLALLFPNERHGDNRVRAGETVSIPDDAHAFRFRLAPPPGIDRVKAIVSLDPVRITAADLSGGQDAPGGRSRAGTARAVEVIEREARRLDPARWAEAHVEFEVTP